MSYGKRFLHRNFNFPMFWKLNLRKKYEKILVNSFDYGKLHEIPNILPLHMIWQLSEWRRKICKHWNSTFKTGYYWGSCNSIFSFISMFCTFVFVLLPFFLWPFREANCTKAQKDHSKIKIRNSRLNIWNSKFEIRYPDEPMGWKITNWCSLWAIKCRLTYNCTSN
jgi:hypothetical protein